MRTLQDGEDHPCKCSEKHAVLMNDETIHIKRSYFENTRYYLCRKCEAKWRIVEWLVGQHSTIHIDREPYQEEEE